MFIVREFMVFSELVVPKTIIKLGLQGLQLCLVMPAQPARVNAAKSTSKNWNFGTIFNGWKEGFNR